MKTKFWKKYPQLTALFGACAVLGVFAFSGLMSVAGALSILGATQLLLLALCPMTGACCEVAVLTPEQVREFTEIITGFKGYGELLKKLTEAAKSVEGLPGLFEMPKKFADECKRSDELKGEIKKLQRRAASFSPAGVRWVGAVPFVSDECATAMSAWFTLEVARFGAANNADTMRFLAPSKTAQDALVAKACSVFDLEYKTTLTTTEIPFPVQYVSQIRELVFAYGQARQFCTVYPLGSGSTKLPRTKAGEDDFGFLGTTTGSQSQSVTEKTVAVEEVTLEASKGGGIIRIPYEINEDTYIAFGQFVARYVARQFAKLEDKTLFLGDGTATYASITGIGKYCTTNTSYLLQLAAGKTKPSDVTRTDIRNLRGKVSAAVLGNMAANGQTAAAYYMHPSWEPFLSELNNDQSIIIYKNEGGKATLDGYPIRWIGVSEPYGTAAAAAKYLMFFGDLSYWYLGERGSPRLEISREVFFATDELAMRALERIDFDTLAVDAMATLKTPAS